MQRCPMCGREKENVRCLYCGYDESTDFIRYRTVTFVNVTTDAYDGNFEDDNGWNRDIWEDDGLSGNIQDDNRIPSNEEVMQMKWPVDASKSEKQKKRRQRKTKWWQILLAVLLICVLFNMAFCDEPSKQRNTDSTEDSSETNGMENVDSLNKISDEESSSEMDTNEIIYKNVEEFVNSGVLDEEIASSLEDLESIGIHMDIYGIENKLVYTYTYEEYTKDEIDADSLQAGLESEADTFKQIAESLRTVVKEDNPVVKVVYKDKNGEIVYTGEFSASE